MPLTRKRRRPMSKNECTTAEIAIHYDLKAKKHSVKFKDKDGWKDADENTTLPNPAEIIETQTITLVKVKQNPCYIIVYFAGRGIPIQVPC
jgi:hypothetical protein